MSRLPAPCLCAVTARRRLSPDARTPRDEMLALREFVERLIDAGVDAIQIREADLGAAELEEVVTAAVAAASGALTKIIVNTRVDVARSASADGVHLKEADPASVSDIRREAPALIVGRSAHRDMLGGHPGADYVIFGPVYPTDSKPGALTAGLQGLERAVAEAGCPVLAIGGITPARAGLCLGAGASGVAAIGAFLPEGRSPDALGPARAVQAFREAFTR